MLLLWLTLQDVLESQMGMRLADMTHYSQLDEDQRAQTALPGAHPPVKGFYLIQPSPAALPSSRPPGRSSSLLTRLRQPRSSSSSQSLAPSMSLSMSQSQDQPQSHSQSLSNPQVQSQEHPEPLDSSSHDGAGKLSAAQPSSTDVVVNVDEAEVGEPRFTH